MGSEARRDQIAPQIQTLLRRASMRLFVSDLMGRVAVTLTGAIGIMVALRLSQKFVPWTLPWLEVLAGGVVLALLAAVVWAFIRLPRGLALADEVDRRAGLRESVSTSIALAGSHDSWSTAVKENAVERVSRVVLKDAIPIKATGGGQGPLIAVVLLAAVWFLPTWDVTGLFEEKQIAEEQQQELELVKAAVKSQEDELKKAMARAGVEFVDEETQEADEALEGTPKKAEDIRRQAIRKLTKVTDKLDEIQNGEQAKKLEAMKNQLRKLKTPGQGPLTEFSRALARGNFAEAQKQLNQLANQMQSGELSEEQQKQAAEQFKNLAEQLEQLADQREELEKKLQEAGMTAEQAKQAAKDPSKLEQMLQQMPGIPAPQQAAMRQAAQAQQKASESMQSMAQASQQCSQAGQQQSGQQGQQGSQGQQMAQGMQQMSDQLGSAEMAQQESAAAQAAMQMAQQQLEKMGESMCEGGACAGGTNPGAGPGKTGKWSEGQAMAQGKGSGGPGRGNGVSPDAIAEDYVLKTEKENVRNTGGPIIGSSVVYGAQVRGESTAQFSEAVGAASVEAAEAIETMAVPREYQDAVRHYFGRLEARAKAAKDATPPASKATDSE